MIRKILLSVLYVTMAANAASMIGLEALGKPTEGASAIMLGRGYAGGAKTGSGITPWNPASLAFEESTSHTETKDWKRVYASASTESTGALTIVKVQKSNYAITIR